MGYENMTEMITVLYGEKKLEPVKYTIKSKTVAVKKLFGLYTKQETEYYVETEFMTISGFKTHAEALEMLLTGGIKMSEIIQ